MSGLKPGPNPKCDSEYLLQQRAVFGLDFGVFWGDDYGGGYFVVGVEEVTCPRKSLPVEAGVLS